MWESVSKNWGYLTIIVVILSAGFGAGIWVKGSLDVINTMPAKIATLTKRIGPLEGLIKDLPKEIENARCNLAAQTVIAKNDVKIYAAAFEIATIEGQSNDLIMQEELTEHVRQKLDKLSKRQGRLENDITEFNRQRERHIRIISEECR